MDKTRYISALTSCFALRDECAQKLASSSSFALLDGWDQVQSYSLSITFALVLALASKSSLGTWVDETALFFLHHHIQWVVMHNNATKFLFFFLFFLVNHFHIPICYIAYFCSTIEIFSASLLYCSCLVPSFTQLVVLHLWHCNITIKSKL